MKYLWLASLAFITEGQTNDARNRETVRNQDVSVNCTGGFTAGGDQDTGGTCRGAADVAAYTEGTMFASVGHYMANTGLMACDTWRGNTTCQSGICFCAEEGVCAVNGQCGGRIGTMTCGGTSNGLPCQFPFEYLGVEYDECTTEGVPSGSDYSWCYVAGGVRWGKCDCQADCFDTEDYIDARGFNCTSWEGIYCPGARMYGFNQTGIDDLLANCPLTCRECFPPAAVPGSGDVVEYKVRGSIMFTVPQSSADAFVTDDDVNEALSGGMDTLAGELAVGGAVIELDRASADEGLTVFCEMEDCDFGHVLKLVLPESCAGSACTDSECCTTPPGCAAADCNPDTHVLMASPPTACETAECTQEECCDWRAVCTSDVCPAATHVLMDDPALCAGASCLPSECCDARGTCGSMAAPSPAASAGPSTGPAVVVFSEDWEGCPAASHVDKATTDLPDLCAYARCSIDECCDARGICAPNDGLCVEATHVPNGREESCAAAACLQDECCNARDTCVAADCTAPVDITATHVFTNVRACDEVCAQADCCAPRAACAIDSCDRLLVLKTKTLAADFLCVGTTCDEDECCEFVFDGYLRQAGQELTTAIADTDAYSTASDAIGACTEDGACQGVTCAVTSVNGMATGPCHLRATGASNADASYVSFVSVTCESSVCTANWIFKSQPPQSCAGAPCLEAECCDERDVCTNFDCPADSHIDGGSVATGDRCAGAQCLLGECCAQRDTCVVAVDCVPATHVAKAQIELYCAGTNCGVAECCDTRAECTDAVCGNSHVIKPTALLNLFLANGKCAGPECTIGECCNPRPACQESVCNPALNVFSPSVALCAATACTTNECCAARATCDAGACGTTHVLLPDGDSNRVALCATDECTPEECCVPRGQCSREACDVDSYLTDDYEGRLTDGLCAGSACTSAECCQICPFAGDWEPSGPLAGSGVLPIAATATGGWEMQMGGGLGWPLTIERSSESSAECQAKVNVDEFTIALGEMSESQDAISWNNVLGNAVFNRVAAGARRLEATLAASLIVPQQRRLQQRDIRMDFEFDTATDNDAVQLKGRFEAMELMEIEDALRDALANCQGCSNYTIGSVYMTSDYETETIVTPGRTQSWAARSADVWMPLSAIVAALFFM